MNPLSAWTLATLDIHGGGFKEARVATEAERAQIIQALGLISLAGLKASYRIDRLAGGGYRLHGHIESDLEQPCIVTLDPVPQHVTEDFDTEFWADLQPPSGEQDTGVLEGRDVEALANGQIDAGRIVFETLSAALDPYPRKAGAEFNWQDQASETPEKTHPFAALSKLKDKT